MVAEFANGNNNFILLFSVIKHEVNSFRNALNTFALACILGINVLAPAAPDLPHIIAYI